MIRGASGQTSLLREEDCPLDPLLGLTCAILGYGNQGEAHALNLRDSGLSVLVGARAGGAAAARATAHGFDVRSIEEVARDADLIALLSPDETHLELIASLRAVTPCRVSTLVFAHGFALRFQRPPLEASWDAIVVAPAGPGAQLRSRYVEGGGIPAMLAIGQDGSGEAQARGRAYARAIGCARAGVFSTTIEAEAEIDLFGEQAVLCGGMNALLETAFETLTSRGYPPELAYLECVQQLRLTAELVERFGIEGMRRRISPTALYGDLSRGRRVIGPEARAAMAELLEEVHSGRFAQEWLEAARRDPGWKDEALRARRDAAMEEAGARVRSLFRRPEPGSPPTGEESD